MKKSRPIHCILLALLMLVFAQPLFAQIGISVSFGPPALPVYEQPLCPEEGYIWTPGYWAYDEDDGYYWVPGTWVEAPQPGYLWTPGWWGWGGSAFLFHEGYWGPHIGFYGGINYGYGYFGNGFEGGRWDGGHFFYNRAVSNVNITNIHNTYNTTVVNDVTVNHVSYNGGNGGINARATPEQQTWAQERHLAPVPAQAQHLQTARANPELRASANQGKPPIAATDRPAAFTGHGVVAAREAGAPYHPEPNHGLGPSANRGPSPAANPTHASELQQHQAATPQGTGNPKQDQKYQQQQAKLAAKENQQHQQLQARQEQDHQRMQQQQAQQQQRMAQQQQNQARQQQMAQQNQARQQQMEQQHQQQTQRMEQQHSQQQQNLQMRQMGGGGHGGGRPR